MSLMAEVNKNQVMGDELRPIWHFPSLFFSDSQASQRIASPA